MVVNERQGDQKGSCHTWSSPTTIRPAPPLAWPPTRSTWAGSRASLSLFSIPPRLPAIRAWPATISHAATWRQIGFPLEHKLLYRTFPQQCPSWMRTSASPSIAASFFSNLHDRSGMPTHLPDGLTQYGLEHSNKESPPYHVTHDDVSAALPRLRVERISGYQSLRCRGGVIAGIHETHWIGLSRPSWGRDMDL